MANPQRFTLKKIPLDPLYCNIATGSADNFHITTIPLEDSPHFKGLSQDLKIYEDYVDEFLGGPLTADYSATGFLRLSRRLRYLEGPFKNKYVVVRSYKNSYQILDGLHRASILRYQGNKRIHASVLQ
jgi:hypothetical protein